MTAFAKILIFFGIILVILGIILLIIPKVPFLGKLPGDIYIKKEKFAFYFPLATCLILSVVISLIFWIFRSK
ncbi:MAG: DUF2905 domain-containing protein [Elusimicrobia bacterium]|nr:DUF2905 domain-containing protein [Elusimicrobiota bacterium]